jgi:hypothetical protein
MQKQWWEKRLIYSTPTSSLKGQHRIGKQQLIGESAPQESSSEGEEKTARRIE